MAREHATPRFDSPQQEAYLSLWRTYDRLRGFEDELFARFDLTAQQYNVLRLLKAESPRETMALADRLISRAPDITRKLDKLEARGLIVRERPPENRRVVRIVIAPAGRELLREMAKPVRECAARQLGHVSAEQLRQLTELLRAVRAPHEEPGGDWC